MPLTREGVRAAIERAGDQHWRALVAHHEEAYPASRPTPGDVSRREAERLNEMGYGDAGRWELVETQVRRDGDRVTLVHRVRDRQAGTTIETEPYTNYE
jgi:L-amino acid N-acyltransferase YncA